MSLFRLLCVAIAIAVSAGLVIETLFDDAGWGRRERIRAELRALQAANSETQTRAATLQQQIDALRTRPDVQERAVRHELGYLRPDDVIINLGDAAP